VGSLSVQFGSVLCVGDVGSWVGINVGCFVGGWVGDCVANSFVGDSDFFFVGETVRVHAKDIVLLLCKHNQDKYFRTFVWTYNIYEYMMLLYFKVI
jgi:hypothetical protein